jgi:hypothetical protein
VKIKKFIFSWLISAVIMYSLSYAWHGILLNDFDRISFPRGAYLTMAAFVYLLIGFIVASAYNSEAIERISKKPILKGLVAGVICGFVLYIVALVVGVSFGGRSLENILIDVFWQVIEQGIGGLVVGYLHVLIEINGWFYSPSEDHQ